jgi:hypothetical protein
MATQPFFGDPTAKARVWSQFAVLLGGLTADVPDGNEAFTLNNPTGTPVTGQWDPVGALADDTPFDDGSESITTTPHSAAGFGIYALSFSDQSETITFTAKETTLTTLGIIYDVSDLTDASGVISGDLAQRDPTKKYLVGFHRENAVDCERYITKNHAVIESISRSFGNKESLRSVTLRVMPDPTDLSADGRPKLWSYYLGEKA